jgi:hypothetical protein
MRKVTSSATMSDEEVNDLHRFSGSKIVSTGKNSKIDFSGTPVPCKVGTGKSFHEKQCEASYVIANRNMAGDWGFKEAFEIGYKSALCVVIADMEKYARELNLKTSDASFYGAEYLYEFLENRLGVEGAKGRLDPMCGRGKGAKQNK